MASETIVRVACRFARGGFAHERKFMIAAPGGGHYTGTAYIAYCFTREGAPIKPDEPPLGQTMEGLLEARVVANAGMLVTISVPDGGVCDVSEDLIHSVTNVSVKP